MDIKNNYNECITNLACSIQEYFGIENRHNTLSYVDDILREKNPDNVVLILFDGMGSRILNRVLEGNSFLIKNRYKEITTVFPATTVAATTAIRTGLNPVESGMLGWNMYYNKLDKTITTFFGYEKGDKEEKILQDAVKYRKENMKEKTIVDQINEKNIFKAYELMPFGEDPYNDIEDMFSKIENICKKEGRKYIYAYDVEPDSSMHQTGSDSNIVKDLIRKRNDMVEKLYNNLKGTNTVIFVIADHGHMNVENIFLKDYPEIKEMLLRTTSLEQRAVNMFVKEEYKEKFKQVFNNEFEDDFYLCSKEELLLDKLFGDGIENPIFRNAVRRLYRNC